MFRKPVFWILFAALSAGSALFSAIYFSTAFPIVSLDIRMDRDAALRAARDLAAKYNWPPTDFDQAVAFAGTPEVQNFIELEGGGKEELARVLESGSYSPYTWRVRHYREGETHETNIRFTPDGRPYAFQVKLPEQEPGAAIERDEARIIAERGAANEWGIDIGSYALVESSLETRSGGRRDHIFVYERQDARLGEGRYRLRLVVAGEKVTELDPFVLVPEAFSRRYQEMRSANDSIGAFDSVVLFAVYILGCCGVGLFYLVRHRWLIWKPALLWSLVICGLVALDVFNNWSGLWMSYDTALSASGFAAEQVATAFGLFALMSALLCISFMTAESLSRRAFPQHVQLWRLWSPRVAGSKPILGQISAGYLLVAVFFAYEVLLYAFAHSRFGWWTPSDTLINPDLFGSYFPFLPAVANSLQAGFWEECLFRAVPLATAALLGDRFGARRPFIIVAMVVQALVFGAGHAGYVNQPAYARVLELIIPSLAFGGLYLAFGLLPGIILHYVFDLVWFAMPIFLSSSPRAPLEQMFVLVLAFAPLGVTLLARARASRWQELPEEAMNGAWKPMEKEVVTEEPIPVAAGVMPDFVRRVLPVAGAAGLVLWLVFSSFRSDVPPLPISRSQAEQESRIVLNQRGVVLDSAWKALSRPETQPGESHRFVWRTSGTEAYKQLQGTYLPDPRWVVRFAKFEGDVAARAEEYIVVVGPAGSTVRVRHLLPEASPGANLTEEEARRLAVTAALQAEEIPPESFREISAEAQKRPNRTDWTFQFEDVRDYGLEQGQARIAVTVAGDEVADVNRYVFVPEAWSREERGRRSLPDLLGIICSVILVALLGAGVIRAVVRWARRRPFSVRAFLTFSLLLFLVLAMDGLNGWPGVVSQLSTVQILVIFAVNLFAVFILALALGLGAGSVMAGARERSAVGVNQAAIFGISAGALAVAAGAIGQALSRDQDPQWLGFAGISSWSPFLANAIGPLNSVLITTIAAALLFQHAEDLSSGWRRRRGLTVAFLIVVGIVAVGMTEIETIGQWLWTGTLAGLFVAGGYVFVFRHSFAILPFAAATGSILGILAAGFVQAHPTALPGALAGSALAALSAWIWGSRAAA